MVVIIILYYPEPNEACSPSVPIFLTLSVTNLIRQESTLLPEVQRFQSTFGCGGVSVGQGFSRLGWPVRTLSFSHDGKMLASASEGHFIEITEVETGDKLWEVQRESWPSVWCGIHQASASICLMTKMANTTAARSWNWEAV